MSELWEKAVKFHGHACPGLAIGVRASKTALEKLGVERAKDEELVAIVETDACGVDGVQVITGCTIGKGNLFFKDYGKQVYIIAKRNDGQAVRMAFKHVNLNDEQKRIREKIFKGTASEGEKELFKEMQEKRIDHILNGPAEELFNIRHVKIDLPEKARIFNSVRCGECGEYCMEPRARMQEGKIVCLECFEEYSRG